MEGIEDATHKAQQRQRQGRTLDAIRLFEQALELRIDLHGPESSSVKKACDNLSDILNGAALKHLQCEEYEEAKKLLQKAEMLTGPDDLISAVTYNNIACYYRRCCSSRIYVPSARFVVSEMPRFTQLPLRSTHQKVPQHEHSRRNVCCPSFRGWTSAKRPGAWLVLDAMEGPGI